MDEESDAIPSADPNPFDAAPDQPGAAGPPSRLAFDAPAPGTGTGASRFEGDELPLEGESPTAGSLTSSPTAHVDLVPAASGKEASSTEYGSLFAAAVKSAGEVSAAAVTAAAVGHGLPAPVAAASAKAAAERQAVVNQATQAATPAAQLAQLPNRVPARSVSTGTVVAVGIGGVVVIGLVALAATRKPRRS